MSRLETSSLFQLTTMRFRLFLREPEAIFWTFVFPILLAIGLGIAFRNRPADVLQVGATTTQLTQALTPDKGLTAATMDEAEGTHELATGKILLLAIQRPDGVAYKFDDTNPDARTARLLADRAIQTAAGRREAVRAENQLVHETGARYIDFVVPGLLGMNLMGSAMWGLGFAIVEARQKKLLKRLVASPMPRWQYPRFVPALAAGHAGHRGRGLPGLCAAGLRRALSRLAMGIGIAVRAHLAGLFRAGIAGSSRAKTMEAASGLMNLSMLPMWILSGVFFSASRFPVSIQPLVRALPLTAAIDALRGNMLQGMSLNQLATPIAILLAWLLAAFAVSLRIFRWR